MPLRPSAWICLPTDSSTWRLSQTKVLSSSSSLRLRLGQRHVEQLGQLLERGRIVARHVFGNGPDAGRRYAGGQDQAVAVDDAAAVGRQRQRAREAHLALALVEVVGHHLDVHRACRQADESQRDGGHDQLAAPDRRAAGQQRAGGVGNALAAHGRTPALRCAAFAVRLRGSAFMAASRRCACGAVGRSRRGAGVGVGDVVGDGRRRRAHLQLFARQLLDPLRRGLRAAFELQAVALGLEAAAFGVGALELGEQAARLVLDVDQVQRAGQHGQQQDQVEPGHASVLCATRMTALRARGLAPTSRPRA